MEIGSAPKHVAIVGNASDYTKYIRMKATVAPYTTSGSAADAKPTLGWKSNELAISVRSFLPLNGSLPK